MACSLNDGCSNVTNQSSVILKHTVSLDSPAVGEPVNMHGNSRCTSSGPGGRGVPTTGLIIRGFRADKALTEGSEQASIVTQLRVLLRPLNVLRHDGALASRLENRSEQTNDGQRH